MGYSDKCSNMETYFDKHRGECVQCDFTRIKPGTEFSPNCGFTDDGGRRERLLRNCIAGITFNNGSFTKCQKCTSCQAGYQTVSNCTANTDTQCRQQEPGTTNNDASNVTPSTTFPQTTTTQASGFISTALTTLNIEPTPTPWGVPFVIITCTVVIMAALSCYFIYRKRKRRLRNEHKDQFKTWRDTEKLSPINEEFAVFRQPESKDLEDILSPKVQSAPLQTVLDNLDVLDELVILLDPEGHGVKNTRHLASRCSFSSSWITYTYSMKDSKSPLKTVLEGVCTKHPDWTVGHLSKMLREMGRNDAIAILTKLTLKEVVV
ncbi:IGF-like family receptor 1 [Centroberyx affinis]|uniref:IGF-like family receptor 1 n=1 Tax=Centroberyx affinis TaxID=166261 RepID=UPI003A5BB0C6